MRDAWCDITNLNFDEGVLNLPSASGIDLPEKAETPEDAILFRWRNPNPSVSLKCGSSFDMTNMGSGSFELSISCCIAGYRTVQLRCGSVRAEFQFILSYGSRTFNCWKRFTEFKKLHEVKAHTYMH